MRHSIAGSWTDLTRAISAVARRATRIAGVAASRSRLAAAAPGRRSGSLCRAGGSL